MAFDIFGFSFGKKTDQETKNLESSQIPVTPEPYDGTYTFEAGGVFGTSIDFSGSIRDENQLIGQYRGMALHPEVDSAIEDIVNESIVMGEDRKPIKLNLDYGPVRVLHAQVHPALYHLMNGINLY